MGHGADLSGRNNAEFAFMCMVLVVLTFFCRFFYIRTIIDYQPPSVTFTETLVPVVIQIQEQECGVCYENTTNEAKCSTERCGFVTCSDCYKKLGKKRCPQCGETFVHMTTGTIT